MHLTCHMNGRPTWNDEILSFVPEIGVIPNRLLVSQRSYGYQSALSLRKKRLILYLKLLENHQNKENTKGRSTKFEISPGPWKKRTSTA